MKANDQRIVRILQGAGLLDDGQVRAIDSWQQQWGGKIHHIAVDQGFADEAQVAAALAHGLGMPRVELATSPTEADALRLLDRNFCEENAVIPIAVRDNGATLWAAVSDPTDVALLDSIRARARVARVMPGVAGYHEILAAIRQRLAGQVGVDSSYGIALEAGAGDEEFKVTSMAGSTLVKHVPGIDQLRAEVQVPPAEVEFTSQVDPQSVFIGEPEPAVDRGSVDRARLATINDGLEQSNRALRAVIELCLSRSVFTDAELRTRSSDR